MCYPGPSGVPSSRCTRASTCTSMSTGPTLWCRCRFATVVDFERRRKERDYYPPTQPGDTGIAYNSVDLSLPMIDIEPDTDEAIALEQLLLAQRSKPMPRRTSTTPTTLMDAIGEAPGARGTGRQQDG